MLGLFEGEWGVQVGTIMLDHMQITFVVPQVYIRKHGAGTTRV